MFGAFRELARRREGCPRLKSFRPAEFAAHATDFFRETGWGSIELGTLESVATIDSADWAESDPNARSSFRAATSPPACSPTSLAGCAGRQWR